MKMMSRPLFGFALLLVCSLLIHASFSASTQQRRTLVLLDDMQIKNTHSTFFRALEEKGHNLSFFEATNPDLQLSKYGEYLYDNVVIFAPHVEGTCAISIPLPLFYHQFLPSPLHSQNQQCHLTLHQLYCPTLHSTFYTATSSSASCFN